MDQKTTMRLRTEEQRLMLVAGDFVVACIGLLIALIAWGQRDWLNLTWELFNERIPSWFYFLPFVWLIINVEIYDLRRASNREDTNRHIFIAFAVSLLVYLLIFFLSTPNSLPRRGVGIFLLATTILMLVWRNFSISIITRSGFQSRVIVVGAGRAGTTLGEVVSQMKPPPFMIFGYIDDDEQKHGTDVAGFPVVGGWDQLIPLIEKEKVTDIILAISHELRPELFQALLAAEEMGVEITTMPSSYERLLGRVPIFLLHSDWILRTFLDQVHVSGLYEISKRVLDLVGGLVGTIITLLLTPFIALAIVLDSGRPVFYTQKRLGLRGKEYTIIKFRTMYDDGNKRVRVTVENDDRITRVGRFLRKSHMDEMPQFINVLNGEMSLVGPRAERNELVTILQRKVPFYRARLLVKPGITGWAQINFGYAATVEDTGIKLEYDLYYIKHRNFLMDIIILLRTVGTVVGLKGQ